jgi:8-oxo-dGTP diphosphatase
LQNGFPKEEGDKMNRNTYENLIREAKNQDISRYVVGVVIIRDSTVLLLKRSKDDFMGGIYELPSGEVKGGEALGSALRREVREETVLRIKEVRRYLGHFDYRSKSGKRTRQFNFMVAVREPLKIKLKEHESYAWVNKDQLDQHPVTENVKYVLNLFWKTTIGGQ